MSLVPLGKVLLRNVIRHTDAHNKIQEETEMWKIRELEKQTGDVHWGKQRRMLSKCSSSRMRSDGFDEESQQADWKARNLTPVLATMEDDLHHSRYWNKKLYECEANMPDRWGHSGYKELYPEEFDTDSDQRDEQNSMNGKRKSQPGKELSLELHKRKKAKKSHKKKRKKKSHKRRKKKKKQEQLSVASDSSQETGCSEEGASGAGKRKQKRHRKAKKTPSEPGSGSSREGRCTSSSAEGSGLEEKREKQPRKKRRKRRPSVSERAGEGVQERRSKRKNWKVAADENSEDSSDED